MKGYLITGNPKTLENIKRNCKLLISRGEVTFTPTALHAVEDIAEEVLEGELLADSKEVDLDDIKDLASEDEKATETADSKEVDLDDDKKPSKKAPKK